MTTTTDNDFSKFSSLEVTPPEGGHSHPIKKIWRVAPTIYFIQMENNVFHVEHDGGGDAVIGEGEVRRQLEHALKSL